MTLISNKNKNTEWTIVNQSGGVLSVLAALSSINMSQGAFCNIFSIFKQNKSLQQTGICFSSELSRLAQHSPCCKILAMDNMHEIFEHLFCSLLDTDTLAMFPTCNLPSLSHFDGPNSRSKGNNLLSKSQAYSAMTGPDHEAHKIKAIRGDAYDTAGRTYNSKHIWSFCENVGLVLCHFAGTKHPYQMWPLIRSFGKQMLDICKSLRSEKELLEMLPQVSVEREILKRFVFFQNFVSALKRDSNQQFGTLVLGQGRDFCQLISTSIIANLHSISGIESEFEEQRVSGCLDPATRYRRAKALTFHSAYAELSASLFTLMLREKIQWENSIMRDLVRNDFIASAFKGELNIHRTIEKSASIFNICLRKKSSTVTVSHLTRDLSLSFFRRTGELLLLCDSDSGVNNYANTLFSSMIHGASALLSSNKTASLEALIQAISYRLVLKPEAIGAYSAASSDGLQHAIDDRILCAELLRQDDSNEQTFVLGLREWAMGNLLVYLLKSKDKALRTTSLKLLNCIIETYSSEVILSSQKIRDEKGNLASVTTFTKLFHSLKECLCNFVISNDWDAMSELFVFARHCLALQISRNTAMNESTDRTLLSLAYFSLKNKTHEDDTWVNLAYIFEVSNWLNICGKLVRKKASRILFFDFITRVNSMEEPQSYTVNKAEHEVLEIHHLCSSFKSLDNLEQQLSIRKAKLNNPYDKKLKKKSAQQDLSLLPNDLLAAVETFINYQGGQSM